MNNRLVSTDDVSHEITFKEGILSGINPSLDGKSNSEGTLFIPKYFPKISTDEISALRGESLPALAYSLLSQFLHSDEVPSSVLKQICEESFSFPLPEVSLDNNTSVLELFHGPTCAFKDFGARFMARLFRYFLGSSDSRLTVLVATSGDTGSAVANAFYDSSSSANIRVVILFPKNRISKVQELQMTTLGGNIQCLEVHGSFDDCQKLVKGALADQSLRSSVKLSTANSINIARLLPQMIYYAYSAINHHSGSPPLFVVPTGNLGNLCGGLLAIKIGVPCAGFLAASNRNDPFPRFLSGEPFTPQVTLQTPSNAMDVGNPSNFTRVVSLYGNSLEKIKDDISAQAINDDETRQGISELHKKFGYVACPHTAVGYSALSKYRVQNPGKQYPAVLLATAHPAKFPDVVEQSLGFQPEHPLQLQNLTSASPKKISFLSSSSELKNYLLRSA